MFSKNNSQKKKKQIENSKNRSQLFSRTKFYLETEI